MARTFFQRLRDWREVTSINPTQESPDILGGRQAEHFLQTLVQSHLNFKDASLYPNKRIPAGYRRREIDLVVVTTKRIHVIEIKNWSGSLRVFGNSWIQTNRIGEEIKHPDLISDNLEKNLALIEYLRREGVNLDSKELTKYLCNKIIFMNPRLSVKDPSISKHPNILLRHRLDSYLSKQRRSGLGEQILSSLVQWCLDSELAEVVIDGFFNSLTLEKIKAIRSALDKVGTWDTLEYYGSRVEIGDLINISVDGQVLSRDQIGSRCRCTIDWTRNKLWGFIKALAGSENFGWIQLPNDIKPLSPSDFAFFHRPGEPAPVRIPLLKLNAITLG